MDIHSDPNSLSLGVKHAEVVTPEVVEALREGDHVAYEKVYMHYKKPLEHFIYKLSGSLDETREIVQDVFVNVWEKREQINPRKSIKNYLFVIAKNAALKTIYKRNKHAGIEDYESRLLDDRETTDDLNARETQLLVNIAISNMPRQRREVFDLYRLGLSSEEIADKLHITKENAAKHLSRARKDIRDLVYLIAFFLTIP